MSEPLPEAEVAARLQALVGQLQRELSGFSIVYKDESRLHRAIATLVWPFNRRYAQDYTTVLFGHIAFPSRTYASKLGVRGQYEIICHEAVHLRDARSWPLLFELSYLLLPLPALLTCRALWEWRGYRASLRARHELGLAVDDGWIDGVVARFTGPDYLYMFVWGGLVRRALQRERARLDGEAST